MSDEEFDEEYDEEMDEDEEEDYDGLLTGKHIRTFVFVLLYLSFSC